MQDSVTCTSCVELFYEMAARLWWVQRNPDETTNSQNSMDAQQTVARVPQEYFIYQGDRFTMRNPVIGSSGRCDPRQALP